MARKRYSDEDVLNFLRQIEPSRASGNSVETACRSAGIRSHQALNMKIVNLNSTHKQKTIPLIQYVGGIFLFRETKILSRVGKITT